MVNVHTHAVSRLCCVSVFCVCFYMCVNVKPGCVIVITLPVWGLCGEAVFGVFQFFIVCEAVGASGQHWQTVSMATRAHPSWLHQSHPSAARALCSYWERKAQPPSVSFSIMVCISITSGLGRGTGSENGFPSSSLPFQLAVIFYGSHVYYTVLCVRWRCSWLVCLFFPSLWMTVGDFKSVFRMENRIESTKWKCKTIAYIIFNKIHRRSHI